MTKRKRKAKLIFLWFAFYLFLIKTYILKMHYTSKIPNNNIIDASAKYTSLLYNHILARNLDARTKENKNLKTF